MQCRDRWPRGAAGQGSLAPAPCGGKQKPLWGLGLTPGTAGGGSPSVAHWGLPGGSRRRLVDAAGWGAPTVASGGSPGCSRTGAPRYSGLGVPRGAAGRRSPGDGRLGLPRVHQASIPSASAGRHGRREAPGPAGGRERALAAGDEGVRGGAAGAAAAAAGAVPGLRPPPGELAAVAVVAAG